MVKLAGYSIFMLYFNFKNKKKRNIFLNFYSSDVKMR